MVAVEFLTPWLPKQIQGPPEDFHNTLKEQFTQRWKFGRRVFSLGRIEWAEVSKSKQHFWSLTQSTKRLYTACTAKPKCLEVPRTQTDGWMLSTLCFKPEIFTEVAMLLGFFFVVVFYILKTSPHLLPLFRRMPQRCFPVTHQKWFFLSTTKLNPTLYPLWGE